MYIVTKYHPDEYARIGSHPQKGDSVRVQKRGGFVIFRITSVTSTWVSTEILYDTTNIYGKVCVFGKRRWKQLLDEIPDTYVPTANSYPWLRW